MTGIFLIFSCLCAAFSLRAQADSALISFEAWHTDSYCGGATPDPALLKKLQTPQPIGLNLYLYSVDKPQEPPIILHSTAQSLLPMGVYLLHHKPQPSFSISWLSVLRQKYSTEEIFAAYPKLITAQHSEMLAYLNEQSAGHLDARPWGSPLDRHYEPCRIIRVRADTALQKFEYHTHTLCAWQLDGSPPPPSMRR